MTQEIKPLPPVWVNEDAMNLSEHIQREIDKAFDITPRMQTPEILERAKRATELLRRQQAELHKRFTVPACEIVFERLKVGRV